MSANVAHREIGVFVLYSVIESIMDSSTSTIPHFLQLFEKLLQDPESNDVRVTAVRRVPFFAFPASTDAYVLAGHWAQSACTLNRMRSQRP